MTPIQSAHVADSFRDEGWLSPGFAHRASQVVVAIGRAPDSLAARTVWAVSTEAAHASRAPACPARERLGAAPNAAAAEPLLHAKPSSVPDASDAF